jgi:hypothetical protein
MENLEWLTALPQFDDGPVINSRRQLWSVGGYLGGVAESVFGWQVGRRSLHIAPFLTTAARAARLGPGSEAHAVGPALARAPAGHHPGPAAGAARHRRTGVVPGGAGAAGRPAGPRARIGLPQLSADDHRITVHFGPPVARRHPQSHGLPDVDPTEPVRSAGVLRPMCRAGCRPSPVPAACACRFEAPPSREALRFHIHRDGHRVATGLAEPAWNRPATRSRAWAHVYAVEAEGVFLRPPVGT